MTGVIVCSLVTLTYLITSKRKMAAVAGLIFPFADSITPSVFAILSFSVYSWQPIWNTYCYLLMHPDILPGQFSQLLSVVSYLVFFVPLLLLLLCCQNGIQTWLYSKLILETFAGRIYGTLACNNKYFYHILSVLLYLFHWQITHSPSGILNGK